MGLLGKLLSVGTAMGVSPAILLPMQEKIAPAEVTPGVQWVCNDLSCEICRTESQKPRFTLAS
jgi:hypothetical protein